jgi:CheY-like chemotaxis protein
MSLPLLCFVEDSPDVGTIVQHLARRAGHEAIVCPDALVAWEYLQQALNAEAGSPGRLPDLLFLDLNLPGLSGLDLYLRLQQAGGALAALPAALFTQLSLGPDIAAALDAGLDLVLAKDFLTRPEEWRERTLEILAWRRGHPLIASLDSTSLDAPALPPSEAVTLLNRALRNPALRRLGAEIEAGLLRRAWARAATLYPRLCDSGRAPAVSPSDAHAEAARTPLPSGDLSELEFSRWVTLDGITLQSGPEEHRALPGFFSLLARCLTSQVECFLGGAESATIREVLEPLWTSD